MYFNKHPKLPKYRVLTSSRCLATNRKIHSTNKISSFYYCSHHLLLIFGEVENVSTKRGMSTKGGGNSMFTRFLSPFFWTYHKDHLITLIKLTLKGHLSTWVSCWHRSVMNIGQMLTVRFEIRPNKQVTWMNNRLLLWRDFY